MAADPLFDDFEASGQALSPTEALTLCAVILRDEPRCAANPVQAARARLALSDLITAAAAARFPRTEILETLLARGDFSDRTLLLCHRAMAAAGSSRTDPVLYRFGMKGQA